MMALPSSSPAFRVEPPDVTRGCTYCSRAIMTRLRRRRITESFSKATEQFGSDKLEVRLGGIYTLERISQGSPSDYWTVMENLTAFIRERTRPEATRLAKPLNQRIAEHAYLLWEDAGAYRLCPHAGVLQLVPPPGRC